MNEFRLLSTSGILGYGFPEASLQTGRERKPDAIGVDGGSVDPGPHYLAFSKPFCSARAGARGRDPAVTLISPGTARCAT